MYRVLIFIVFIIASGEVWAQTAICPIEGDQNEVVRNQIVKSFRSRNYDVMPLEVVDKEIAQLGGSGKITSENARSVSLRLRAEILVWGILTELNNRDVAEGQLPLTGPGWRVELNVFDQNNSEAVRSFSRCAGGLSRELLFERVTGYWESQYFTEGPKEQKVETGGPEQGKGGAKNNINSFVTDRGQKAVRRIDRDVKTDEELIGIVVFDPPLNEGKRWTVYDSITADYRQLVRPSGYIPVECEPIPSGWPQYHGKLSLVLKKAQYMAIPSVSPQMKVSSYSPGPAQGVRLYKDKTDNYYLYADRNMEVDFVYQVGKEPQYDSNSLPEDIKFTELSKGKSANLPSDIKEKADRMVKIMGLHNAPSPANVVRTLASYYRSFGTDNEIPQNEPDPYLAITLSKIGVCRHRSFSFYITANYLGIPTRIVENEIHSFVEVYFPNSGWHHLDLGGGMTKVTYRQGTSVNTPGIAVVNKDIPSRQPQQKQSLPLLFENILFISVFAVVVGGGVVLSTYIYAIYKRLAISRTKTVESACVPLLASVTEDKTTMQTIAVIIHEFETALADQRRAYPSGTTYRELVMRLAQKIPDISTYLEEALLIYEKTRYSGDSVNPQEVKKMLALSGTIREALESVHLDVGKVV